MKQRLTKLVILGQRGGIDDTHPKRTGYTGFAEDQSLTGQQLKNLDVRLKVNTLHCHFNPPKKETEMMQSRSC